MLKRTNIYLDRQDLAALAKIAKRQGTKVSILIRQAAKEFVERQKR